MLALRDSLLRVLEYVHLEVCRCERLLGDGDIRVDAGAVGRAGNPIQTDARMRGAAQRQVALRVAVCRHLNVAQAKCQPVAKCQPATYSGDGS